MNKSLLIFLSFIVLSLKLHAGEGMWLPILLKQLNEKEMKSMGMRINAEDIYSINKSSLKDAIVIFGGGCTGEVVSENGLLFTNHHCGYGNIQSHSTLENEYLTHGFWASNYDEELPNTGLTVTFLVSMEDVTEIVLKGVSNNLTDKERETKIAENSKKYLESLTLEQFVNAEIESFYSGNQFFLLLTKTFRDVRLVGTPPSSIGKFGGDTDNWMWPRHTGDFCVFRIYADENNNPASYNKNNRPYKPLRHLTISLKGVAENDFTFVFGFPGRTQEYIPAVAVDQIVNGRNPISIQQRQIRLDIIEKARQKDALVNIQYASKSAGIANGWKKMIGESRGIRITNGVQNKRTFEKQFENWTAKNATEYSDLLNSFNSLYGNYSKYLDNSAYYSDGILGAEIIRFANNFGDAVTFAKDKNIHDTTWNKTIVRLKSYAKGFYKNFNVEVDKQIFADIFESYLNNCPKEIQIPNLYSTYAKYKNTTNWANDIYKKSTFTDSTTVFKLIEKADRKQFAKLKNDPILLLSNIIYDFIKKVLNPNLDTFYTQRDSLQRIYMKAQLQMQPEKHFYPDANFTLRVTYGSILPFNPANGVRYSWFTTLDGIIQKSEQDILDYQIEPRLKELYLSKDYGQYADKDGAMHVAFIASNHTTGGNSGSPIFNADGHLIGLNFDRCWEGTMSDLQYNIDLCRNISVDIRYCLFIIEKYAGAKHLIDEMTIVK